LYFTFYEKVKV